MRTRIAAVGLAALALAAALDRSAVAQREIHHSLPIINPGGDDPDFYHPFMDSTALGHDFQFFAPADIGSFGGSDANYGWFATADRNNIWVSRPNRVNPDNPTDTSSAFRDDNGTGDWTWGNRFELGYMTEEDHGWQAGYWHIDGPSAFDEFEAQRVNVLQPLDTVFGNPNNIDLRGGGGATTPGTGPTLSAAGVPASDRNNPLTETRAYIVAQSVNVADITSFELNKTLRWKPLNNGSMIEPFVGFRYFKFINIHERQFYNRFDGTTGANVGSFPLPPTDPTTLDDELFTRNVAQFDNHMVGAQIGARWFKQKSRWNLSGELRAFVFQNFQYLEVNILDELTYYPDATVGTAPDAVFFRRNTQSAQATEFVYGGELRAQAAYEVTRDVSLRVGANLVELAQGVGRSNTIVRNSEQVTLVGVTFGIDFKR